ncbi:SCO1664 family protein [Nocardioides sp.]|uniref:SCO1664 family protein n=1 Tax=Nocardioides sp. TaxID=35761 RepID=UPI0039E21A37
MTNPSAGHEELVLTGRVMPASNATFVGVLCSTSGADLDVVYKPIAGERPLWDFPDGHLAYREVAAYLVSEALGWDVVPQTWLGDGPHGPGMVQRWVTVDEDQAAVTIVPDGEVPTGWRTSFEGYDDRDRPVRLIHEDSTAMRRIAVFDVVVNNADRKGGHVLEVAGGHRYGIDHGICFHTDPKLRTVLWGWAGSPLTEDETAGLRRLHDALYGEVGDELGHWLAGSDLDALLGRCETLLAAGTLPEPDPHRHAIPWPPF